MILVGTSAVILAFLFKRMVFLLRWGAFLAFLMWVFGAIAFASSGQAITAFVVALPWILFYAYVYLASFFREETGI